MTIVKRKRGNLVKGLSTGGQTDVSRTLMLVTFY